jgi:hypothetical protein
MSSKKKFVALEERVTVVKALELGKRIRVPV